MTYKLKCTLCVKKYGHAKDTENLKLKTIKGKDVLVCNFHETDSSDEKWREYYETSYPLFK